MRGWMDAFLNTLQQRGTSSYGKTPRGLKGRNRRERNTLNFLLQTCLIKLRAQKALASLLFSLQSIPCPQREVLSFGYLHGQVEFLGEESWFARGTLHCNETERRGHTPCYTGDNGRRKSGKK